jgi:O-antigen biosynthesis protein
MERVIPDLVSIITLNWDHYSDLTRPFMGCVGLWTPEPYELIVIDQGSDIKEVQLLQADEAEIPNVRCRFNEENVGFPAGCNLGTSMTRGEYVIWMNNDIIINGEWLEPILRVLNSEEKTVVGASLIDYATGWNTYRDASKKLHTIPYLEGWLIAVRRKFVDQVGLFDESFGLGGMEDVDLCRRARNSGYSLTGINSLPMVHLRGKTVTDGRINQQRITENNLALLRSRLETEGKTNEN